MPIKITPPLAEELRDLYLNQNLTLAQLGEYYHVGETLLLSWLKQFDIRKPKNPPKKPSREELVELYCVQKKGFRELLKRFHVGAKLMQSWFDEYQIEKRNKYEVKSVLGEKNKTERGYTNHSQAHWSKNTCDILNDKDLLKNYIFNQTDKTTAAIAQSLGCSVCVLLRRTHDFGLYEELNHFSSCYETEIKDLIKSWGFTSITDRQQIAPLEIDIYIPELQLGIEFNGDYWHNEQRCEKWYHAYKSKKACEKGIFIYHIFEYEWINPRQKEIMISQLKNLCGLSSHKYFARKCQVREATFQESSDFLNNNHLQGKDVHSLALGLYNNETLVALMTFVKPRFSKQYDQELSRYCVKQNSIVVGGASKLFKHYLREYSHSQETIVSYSNVAKTKGNMYQMLGFVEHHTSNPNYVWINFSKNVKTRYQCQMKQEVKVMQDQGYLRIYDCGNKVWVYSEQNKGDWE